MKNKELGVYRVLSVLEENKAYIGSSKDLKRRSYHHFHSLSKGIHDNRLLQAYYNEFGKDSLTFEVLEYVEDISQLKDREQFWIDSFDFDLLFNIAPNSKSTKGVICSEETKNKISVGLSNSTSPLRRLKGENNPMWGRELSEAHKLAISKSLKARSLKGLTHFNRNRKKTPEQIEKHRISSTGRTHSEETKELLRQQRLGVKFSEEHCKNISNSKKNAEKVTCPYCNLESNSMFMKKWHFDNCKEKPENKNEEFIKKRKENHSCFGKESPLKGTKRIARKVICPHCGAEGGVSNMKRYHFDNCKFKNK